MKCDKIECTLDAIDTCVLIFSDDNTERYSKIHYYCDKHSGACAGRAEYKSKKVGMLMLRRSLIQRPVAQVNKNMQILDMMGAKI